MRRYHYAAADSTNTQARRLAAEWPGEPLLVTAEVQTAGRGRQGRSWLSPRGGAWLSIAWPTRREPEAYAAASLVAAVAVWRALRDVAGGELPTARIKWPNDLLLNGRKVAGILCEQCPAALGRPGFIIVGVGVNVDFDLALLAAELRHPATTLAATLRRPVAVAAVVDAIELRFAEAMEQFEADGFSDPLRDLLEANLAYVGEVKAWQLPTGPIAGRVLGIDQTGRLVLEVNGRTVAYEVGEFSSPLDPGGP